MRDWHLGWAITSVVVMMGAALVLPSCNNANGGGSSTSSTVSTSAVSASATAFATARCNT
jgi:hypothetical protein